VLRWQAVLWAAFGLVLIVAPGWLVEVVFDQPVLGEDAWLRVAGVLAIVLAGQMVLVGHRIEELWWWTWLFVLLELGTAIVFVLNAVTGIADGSPVWPWWVLGGLNMGFALLEVVGLAKTGTERPPG
jgi:hypothetical protein